jgi:spore maturation protein CgeB
MDLLIVGYSAPGQMGRYLGNAAEQLGLNYQILDVARAETSSRILGPYYWRLRDKRPANLARFAARVLDTCSVAKPSTIITTGVRVPLESSHLEKLRGLGINLINYSTDDPWNPAMRTRWFISSLPAYDVVFTPRRRNIEDFRRCGVRDIQYMPFGYDPAVHRPWEESLRPAAPSDVLFVGGCDTDRLPLIGAIADAGFNLALYGHYWRNYSKTRPYSRGFAKQDAIREASASAAVCLCMVRRANRDDHVMRSFEAAAIGGCILAENTKDHRDLYGSSDAAVRYFSSIPELVQQVRSLSTDTEARQRLSLGLRKRMAARTDTYADRLAAMLRYLHSGSA